MLSMERHGLTKEEIVRRGWELYERDIRPKVEPEHERRFLVLDVRSGEYALADDELEAFDLAHEKAPNGIFYLMRIGHLAPHRIGGRSIGFRSRPRPG